jgi:hypothetical protein
MHYFIDSRFKGVSNLIHMKCAYHKPRGILLLFLVLLFIAANAMGTELYIPAIKSEAGKVVKVPLMIDTVDNLAGLKIVMKYDAKLLKYKGAVKTEKTTSLMHIVNDKKPGILIIVMAGPRGIKGQNFSLLNLSFEVANDLKKTVKTAFTITEVQLMSDQLKDVKHTIKASPLTVSPAKK